MYMLASSLHKCTNAYFFLNCILYVKVVGGKFELLFGSYESKLNFSSDKLFEILNNLNILSKRSKNSLIYSGCCF